MHATRRIARACRVCVAMLGVLTDAYRTDDCTTDICAVSSSRRFCRAIRGICRCDFGRHAPAAVFLVFLHLQRVGLFGQKGCKVETRLGGKHLHKGILCSECCPNSLAQIAPRVGNIRPAENIKIPCLRAGHKLPCRYPTSVEWRHRS